MCGVSGVWECVVQVVFVVPARAGVGLQRAAPSLYAQISRSVERAGAGRVALLLFFWGGEVTRGASEAETPTGGARLQQEEAQRHR